MKGVALYVNPALTRRNGDDRDSPLSPETSRSHLQDSLFSWLQPDAASLRENKTLLESDPDDPPVEPADEEEAPDLSHVWVVAAEIEVTPKIASIADYRGSFKASEGQRVDALEVYCKGCRRPYDEVRGDDCAAKIDNTHLIGGDQTKRAKPVENRAEEYFDLRLSDDEVQIRAGKDGHSAFLDWHGSAWIKNFRLYPLRRATATIYAAAPASHLKALDIQIAMRVDDETTRPYVWVGSDGVPESTGRATVKKTRGKGGIADEISKFLEQGGTDA
ncbi:hypothetical protein [Streptomyces sp. NPDC056165]|uniref:hypothetical protein n=1 Tax=Streptomyces sp. NPDC056165 TaxID=3345733 RepID=UPI0035E052A3